MTVLTDKKIPTAGRQRSKMKKLWKRHGIGYAFLAPFLVLFFVFVLLPVFVGMGMSLFHYNLLQPAKFAGLANYKALIFDDDVFLLSLQKTILFAVIIGPAGYIASLMMAWVLNQLKLRSVFSFMFYIPSITSAVAMTVIWQNFFSTDRFGLVNSILLKLNMIDQPILWNQDVRTIFGVCALISVWMSMGNGFLVFLAGFQNLPAEINEQGRIDGIRNRVQELFYLTLPQMKPQLLFGAINSIVTAFAVFDVPMQFAGFPSANYAAHTIVAHMYDFAFVRFQMGYSSAIAVVLFAIMFILGRLCFRLLRSDD